jgi:GLPGLI family protein
MIDLSINVVTSYTDDIPVSGGPESFNGLTGMILQVADMISCAQLKKR